ERGELLAGDLDLQAVGLLPRRETGGADLLRRLDRVRGRREQEEQPERRRVRERRPPPRARAAEGDEALERRDGEERPVGAEHAVLEVVAADPEHVGRMRREAGEREEVRRVALPPSLDEADERGGDERVESELDRCRGPVPPSRRGPAAD